MYKLTSKGFQPQLGASPLSNLLGVVLQPSGLVAPAWASASSELLNLPPGQSSPFPLPPEAEDHVETTGFSSEEEKKWFQHRMSIQWQDKVTILLSLLILFLAKVKFSIKVWFWFSEMPTNALLFDSDAHFQNWRRKLRGDWRLLPYPRDASSSTKPILAPGPLHLLFLLSVKIPPQISTWFAP